MLTEIHEDTKTGELIQVTFQFELSIKSCKWSVAFRTTILMLSNKLSVDTDFSSTLSTRKQAVPHLESLKNN